VSDEDGDDELERARFGRGRGRDSGGGAVDVDGSGGAGVSNQPNNRTADTMDYQEFIGAKRHAAPSTGHSASVQTESILFPFQRACVEWAWEKGRSALFADTGLGKTGMQLTWADGVANETGKPVLILAPLAVTRQTTRESEKFNIDGVRVVGSGEKSARIDVTNYESAHKIDLTKYGGVVLDESSILKNASGHYRNRLVEWFASTPYRLACSATPSPNDHTELGNHSEWLSVMDEAVMRARWFINDLGDTVQPWRLKCHAIEDFWRWTATWSRCVAKPSDMGDYDDSAYNLPPLNIRQNIVNVDITTGADDGMMFRIPEMSATSIHNEKRRTLNDRISRMLSLVEDSGSEPVIIWCETNYEQDAVVQAIPHAIDVRGNLNPQQKADRLLRFSDEGGVIVTKPSIAGMGLNWQHCNRMVFVGGSYSYESFYQAVRRSWRFGQTRPVIADVIMASTERRIWQAIHRKSAQHEQMRAEMLKASRRAAVKYAANTTYNPTHIAPTPPWLVTV
jgi:superfamily II DNA or RNA helicase